MEHTNKILWVIILSGSTLFYSWKGYAQKPDTSQVSNFKAIQINPIPIYKLDLGYRIGRNTHEKIVQAGIQYGLTEFDKQFIRYHIPLASFPVVDSMKNFSISSRESTLGGFIGMQQRRPFFRKSYREYLHNPSLLFWGYRGEIHSVQYQYKSHATTYKYNNNQWEEGPTVPYENAREIRNRIAVGLITGIQWHLGRNFFFETYLGPTLFWVIRTDQMIRKTDTFIYLGYDSNLLIGYKIYGRK